MKMSLNALHAVLGVLFFSLMSPVFAQDSNQTEPSFTTKLELNVNVDSNGAVVFIEEDTLFTIYHSVGSISVAERANILNRRFAALKVNYIKDKDSIYHEKGKEISTIWSKNDVLVQSSKIEAEYLGLTLKTLSNQRYAVIHDYFEFQLSQRETVIQYLFSLGIIIAALLMIHYMLRGLFRRLNKWIDKKKGKYIKGIRIKDYEVMDQADELEIIHKLIAGLRIVFMLIIAYIIFPVIFGLFPATEYIAKSLINLVYEPFSNFFTAFLNYIPNLITIVVIILIVRFILKYLKLLARKIEYGKIKIQGFYPDWSRTTFDILKVLIITLSFVMIFPYLPGAQSDVFKGVSVFIGIIFSIGSTSIVGNLVASLVLTYMRPFKIGDRIKIGEIEGEIIEKTAFVLRIKTPKNEYITIPNANVMNSHIINYNRSITEGGVILFSEVTIGYEVPWRKVHEMLLKAASLTEDLEQEPKPFVLQKGLGDFSVEYQINAFSKRPLYKDLIYSRLHQNIQDIFNEEKVEILSPNYMAQRDGNEVTIPKPEESGRNGDEEKKGES